jgi:hemolysin III
VSHGVGLAASLAVTPVLVVTALDEGAASIVGASVFAATMVLLYLASTLYHAARPGRAKGVLKLLDHSAIYLLIAGSYTPFTLGVLRGAWGWSLFGIIWGLAFTGVLLKAFGALRHKLLSNSLYLLMGWLVIVAAHPLWQRMPGPGLAWLAAGGLAYTFGVPFYASERLRYGHFVWHLCVLLGTSCHVVAVIRYA